MSDDVESLIARIADWTVDETDWEMAIDWEKACAFDGLRATGQREAETRALVDRSIDTQTDDGQFSYGSLDPLFLEWAAEWTIGEYKSIPDPAAIGNSVLEYYDQTGDDYYLDAARRQYEFLQSVERTSEGGIPQQRGELSLAVDGLWMVCPFLARYGRLADEPDAIDDAVHQFEVQSKYLQDDNVGLWRHTWVEQPNSFAQSTFWARGNGWATNAMVDTYQYLPEDHDGRELIEELLPRTFEALLDYQDRTGFWHNILDDPESPLETSGTSMFIYSMNRALDLGIVDDDRFAEAADRAWEVAKGVVDEDGRVRRVAVVPGGPDAPLGTPLHGQGLFLLAASCYQ